MAPDKKANFSVILFETEGSEIKSINVDVKIIPSNL
jgi:hypothetical protein